MFDSVELSRAICLSRLAYIQAFRSGVIGLGITIILGLRCDHLGKVVLSFLLFPRGGPHIQKRTATALMAKPSIALCDGVRNLGARANVRDSPSGGGHISANRRALTAKKQTSSQLCVMSVLEKP